MNAFLKVVVVFAHAAVVSLLFVSPIIWIVRDGLGPNTVESHGLETLGRAFMTFYWGPAIMVFSLMAVWGHVIWWKKEAGATPIADPPLHARTQRGGEDDSDGPTP